VRVVDAVATSFDISNSTVITRYRATACIARTANIDKTDCFIVCDSAHECANSRALPEWIRLALSRGCWFFIGSRDMARVLCWNPMLLQLIPWI